MKKMIYLTLLLVILTGCSISRVDTTSFDSMIESVLYNDNKLFNTLFDGYKFYNPRGTSIREQNDYNITISDSKNTYCLYVDIVSYYYKTKEKHDVDKNIFYSKNLNYKNSVGYIDISEVNDKYFIEAMYNYAKIEAYVEKDSLKDAFLNVCYILSSIDFNESAINYLLSTHEFDLSTEEFSIFKSKKDDDNFLKYVEEFDKYNDTNKKTNDSDIIDTDESE